MEIFIAILSSSTIAAIITAIATVMQNRKNNSINHITEERKLWREKIREIAADIEKSKYRGEGQENINNYLVQLQVRINTYGILLKSDFKRDGHIWETIDKFKNIDDERIFEQEKEILLKYISLMLKEDWECSKREIKGLYNNILFIFMYVLLFILSTLYCFIILNINNIWEYVLFQMMVLLFWVILKFYIYDKIMEITNNKRLLTIKKLKRAEWKYACVFGVFVITMLTYLIVVYVCVDIVLKDRIFDNTVYNVQENNLEIYVNGIDEKYMYSFKKILEGSINKRIIIVNSNEEREKIEEKNKIDNGVVIDRELYDSVIKIGLSKQMAIPNFILYLFYVGYMAVCMLMILNDNREIKKQEPEKLIIQIQYTKSDLYTKEIIKLINILSYIIDMEELVGEKYEELLGLERKILKKMQIGLKKKYDSLNIEIYTLEGYEYMDKIKKAIDIIKKSIYDLKAVAGRMKDVERRNVLRRIKSNIDELYNMGNLFRE